jgi:hypothetical protein
VTSAGGRAIKPLARVYAEEGLPELREMPAGEARHVKGSGVEDFVRLIGQRRVTHRGPKDGAQAGGLVGRHGGGRSAPEPVGGRRAAPETHRSRPAISPAESRKGARRGG